MTQKNIYLFNNFHVSEVRKLYTFAPDIRLIRWFSLMLNHAKHPMFCTFTQNHCCYFRSTCMLGDYSVFLLGVKVLSTKRLQLRSKNFPLMFGVPRYGRLHGNLQNPIICDVAITIAIAKWERPLNVFLLWNLLTHKYTQMTFVHTNCKVIV